MAALQVPPAHSQPLPRLISKRQIGKRQACSYADQVRLQGGRANGHQDRRDSQHSARQPAPAPGACSYPFLDTLPCRKFAAALKAIKDEDLWVELNSSNIRDAKLKKVRSAVQFASSPALVCLPAFLTDPALLPPSVQLLEPLKKNQSVTSINLSQNHLTDEAAQVSGGLNLAANCTDTVTASGPRVSAGRCLLQQGHDKGGFISVYAGDFEQSVCLDSSTWLDYP